MAYESTRTHLAKKNISVTRGAVSGYELRFEFLFQFASGDEKNILTLIHELFTMLDLG